MKTIQVMLDKKLLQAADREVRRSKTKRSALVHEAMREYFKKLKIRRMQEQHRAGYAKFPQTDEEIYMWEGEAAWPDE